ncbi:P pilus assembly/Cpx signaling pathway, periplasmic inhibitor/zinc-resistance associated protein [Limihaloglobus sulfuriphilus]|uniref:P pilus assembly/Cpx signaling pathway, periplasmic inhibitor/zinc-resistance associated protein n=1 Tax=Limihaloglobus sulfuriphilus TaxID=1851148 RepID=A0A1Q2MDI3_9BACT|nr:hypothetical protein [Limihaloglobus sulfuriphilus]AQQ70322.1 P pilus assembly/Cpx signaling pathway, periplasmic inhibitor/zinc-resistance associated protein [Limihaloglobus sulfuriphilus]
MDTQKNKFTVRLIRALPLLLIFAAGIVTGYSLSTIIKESRVQLPPRPDMHDRGERTMKKLSEELGLTQDQAQQLREIMKDTFKNLAQIREDARPLIKAEIDSMDAKIKAMLNPDQQTQWERLLGRFKNAVMRPEHGRMWNRRPRPGDDYPHKKGSFEERKPPQPDAEEPLEQP